MAAALHETYTKLVEEIWQDILLLNLHLPGEFIMAIVVRYFIRIHRAIQIAITFLRSKVREIVDLVLNRLIIWLCRHYENDMFSPSY